MARMSADIYSPFSRYMISVGERVSGGFLIIVNRGTKKSWKEMQHPIRGSLRQIKNGGRL
jgi:hypothetical protein